MGPVQLAFTLFWFSFNVFGQHQQKSLEDSLDSMFTDLENTYSAKYHLIDADFVRREADYKDDFGAKLEKLINNIEKKYEEKIAEQERKFKLLEEKFDKKFSNMVSEYEFKLLEQERKFGSLEESKINTELKPVQRPARLLNQPSTPPTQPPPVTRSKVAFYAQLSKDVFHIGNYQAIVFDIATTNIGRHYNANDGVFTVPYDGTYVFSWTAANEDRSHMQTELVVNGQIFGRTWSDSMDHDDRSVASNMVVLDLHTKDAVWIRSNTVHSGQIMGNLMSSFSGWLLYDA